MNSAEPTANPLLAPLLALLRQASGSYKVHELLAELRRQEFIPPLPGDEQQLFRLNFLIMNALYQLQAELHDEGWWLLISTLDIRIEPLAPRNTASALARGEALRSYYLDWQVFWQTDREEVEALLGSFWRAYARDEHRAEALTLFALPAGAGGRCRHLHPPALGLGTPQDGQMSRLMAAATTRLEVASSVTGGCHDSQ